VYPGLRAEVVVQHNYVPSFKKLPGNVYLIMVLKVCHALFTFKMDDGLNILDALSFQAFPGENVSKFANEVQYIIKIMKGVCALPYQLGSQILQKVCASQSPHFNRSMYN